MRPENIIIHGVKTYAPLPWPKTKMPGIIFLIRYKALVKPKVLDLKVSELEE